MDKEGRVEWRLGSAEVRSRTPHLSTVTGLIGADVGLSAALLKAANSPLFGLRNKLASIREALAVLGLGTVEVLVREHVLRAGLCRKGAPAMERFWDASHKIALVSRYLSRRLPGVDADDAYTYGLFRDCGIALMLQRFDDYKQTLTTANADALGKFTDLEQERYRTDHTVVGHLLARSWHLPGHICDAVLSHHEYPLLDGAAAQMDAAASRLIACALLAERCVQEGTGKAQSAEWEKGGAIALAHLSVSEAEFDELADDVLPLLGRM